MKWILRTLEKTINGYLGLDPLSQAKLARLSGKVIQLSITDWPITLCMKPTHDYLKITTDIDLPADTRIEGTSWGLLKVGLAKGDSTVLFKEGVTIHGDMLVGETIRELLAHVDIDWEAQLSTIVGDIAAHQISVHANRFLDFGKSTAVILQENVRDYLQTESKQLPTHTEVTHFVEQVTQLQNAVDRLEARLTHWRNQGNYA